MVVSQKVKVLALPETINEKSTFRAKSQLDKIQILQHQLFQVSSFI